MVSKKAATRNRVATTPAEGPVLMVRNPDRDYALVTLDVVDFGGSHVDGWVFRFTDPNLARQLLTEQEGCWTVCPDFDSGLERGAALEAGIAPPKKDPNRRPISAADLKPAGTDTPTTARTSGAATPDVDDEGDAEQVEYERLLADGLSDAEARATVWPEQAEEDDVTDDDVPDVDVITDHWPPDAAPSQPKKKKSKKESSKKSKKRR